MTITWYGENCFRIQSGQISIITDPPASSSGLKKPRFKYDIFLKSLTPTPIQPIQEEAFVVSGPGEYQMQNLVIRGFPLVTDSTNSYLKTIYLINDSEVVLCFLGHISIAQLDANIIESLSEVDVVIIPGGGMPFLQQDTAVKLIHQIQPSIVIPSCFKVKGLTRSSENISKFLKEFGAQEKHPESEKVTIKKKDVTSEETKVVVLGKIH